MACAIACQKTAPRPAAVKAMTVAEATGFFWLELLELLELSELPLELSLDSLEELLEDSFEFESFDESPESFDELPESLDESPELADESPEPSDELPDPSDELPEPESEFEPPEESCWANAPDCAEALNGVPLVATGVWHPVAASQIPTHIMTVLRDVFMVPGN